jgi:hypothetical protein
VTGLMVVSKPLIVAGVVAWAAIIAGMLTVQRGPAPAQQLSPSVAMFNVRWEDAMMVEQPKRADRFLYREPEPIKVKTERVVLAPDVVEEKPVKVVKLAQASIPRARDVCSRHGMKKVKVRGGRSWRCRR